MMRQGYKYPIYIFLLLYTALPLYSTTGITATDSAKAQQFLDKIKEYSDLGIYDSALARADISLRYFDSLKLNDYKFMALIQKGAIYRNQGNFVEALNIFNNILNAYGDSARYRIITLNHIGAMYRHKGDYPAALNSYYKALRIIQNTKAEHTQAGIYNNIGVVHLYQHSYEKALEFYTLALNIYKKENDIDGLGTANINIGEVFRKKNDYSNAIKYYQDALVYVRQCADYDGIGTIYNEIAGIYIEQNKLSNASQYLKMAMKTFSMQNSVLRIAECNISYGNYYLAQKRYHRAIEYYNKALQLAQQKNMLELQSSATKKISNTYEKMGDTNAALQYYKKHIVIRDSIYNNTNMRKSIEAELFYKLSQQQEDMSVEQAKKEAIFQARSDKQRIVRNYLFLVIVLMLIIIGGTFITLRKNKEKTKKLKLHQQKIQIQNEELQQKQEEITAQRDEIERSNKVLEQSKKIISEKNKRLINSIEYAQTIQKALLPENEEINKYFTDYFVINRPKDIVSGDFYWINKQNDYIDVAIMDCTGHGVPGAFMSLIGNTLLNQIVKEWQIHNPAVILDNFDEILHNMLQRDESKMPVHSSIDVGLLSINKSLKVATFASANRPLIYFQNGKPIKIGSTPRSAGDHLLLHNAYFKNTEISLMPDSCFYLTSDGFTDQMNEEQKRFGQRNLLKLLQEIHDKPMCKQQEILINSFDNFRGSEEQTDDVCLVGIRP